MSKLKKKMFRDIKLNKSQFIAIFLMVFLGVLVYGGVRSYMDGMINTAEVFYRENNLEDLNVVGNNFSKDDLEKIKNIRNFLTSFKDGSQKTIHDISSIMEEKEKRKKMYKKMLIVGIPVEITGIVTFVIGILQGIWIPFFVTTAVYTICAVFLANYWYKRIEYICPECHTRFQPRKMETLLANHNPKMRKLTCPSCRRKIWSLEVYRKEVDA